MAIFRVLVLVALVGQVSGVDPHSGSPASTGIPPKASSSAGKLPIGAKPKLQKKQGVIHWEDGSSEVCEGEFLVEKKRPRPPTCEPPGRQPVCKIPRPPPNAPPAFVSGSEESAQCVENEDEEVQEQEEQEDPVEPAAASSSDSNSASHSDSNWDFLVSYHENRTEEVPSDQSAFGEENWNVGSRGGGVQINGVSYDGRNAPYVCPVVGSWTDRQLAEVASFHNTEEVPSAQSDDQAWEQSNEQDDERFVPVAENDPCKFCRATSVGLTYTRKWNGWWREY